MSENSEVFNKTEIIDFTGQPMKDGVAYKYIEYSLDQSGFILKYVMTVDGCTKYNRDFISDYCFKREFRNRDEWVDSIESESVENLKESFNE